MISHSRIVSLAAALALLVTLMGGGGGPAEAAFPGVNGRIVFESNSNIWTMDSNGLDKRNLMPKNDYSSYEPQWAPDGTKIAFSRLAKISGPGYHEEIYTMNADGSGFRRLTYNTAWDTGPSWSRDGTKIAFMRNGAATTSGRRDWNLWVMNADGSAQRQLTSTPEDDYDPAWSPDGRTIAFSRTGVLYLMNPDGTNQRRLSSGGGYGYAPDWSPDGTRLVFDARRSGAGTFSQEEIATIGADGTDERFITDSADLWDLDPAFSPNGRFFAFSSCPFEIESESFATLTSCRIRTMRLDGSSQVNFTNPPLDTYHSDPGWQPLPAFRLDGSATTINFQEDLRVAGRFVYPSPSTRSGRVLTLWQQPAGSFKDFVPVPGAETTTGDEGSFTFDKIQPKDNTNYQIRFAGDQKAGLKPTMSPIKPVDVRVLVALDLSSEKVTLGKPLVVSGDVQPAHAGDVILTIKRDGERISQKGVRLDEGSAFSFSYIPSRTGTYSVTARYPGDDDHAEGRSPIRYFEVLE